MNLITIESPGRDEFPLNARLANLGGMLGFLVAAVAVTLMAASSLDAQTSPPVADWQFHDDLLDHLNGKWMATGIVHGNPATLNIEAEWVLEHQYLLLHEKSAGNVPGQPFPFEGFLFIGYNQTGKRYLAHEMTVWGGDDPTEGFVYAYRAGNEIKLVGRDQAEVIRVQRFTWDPIAKSWHIESRRVTAGKEEPPFLDLTVTAAK